MALRAKDQRIADLTQWKQKSEAKNGEFLASILACANGEGFTVEFTRDTLTRVKCSIEHEWVAGKYYDKDKARQPKLPPVLLARGKNK